MLILILIEGEELLPRPVQGLVGKNVTGVATGLGTTVFTAEGEVLTFGFSGVRTEDDQLSGHQVEDFDMVPQVLLALTY